MKIGDFLVFVIGAIISVATISVVLSNQANTAGVIQNSASALGNLLAVAVAPITGTSVTPNTSYSTTNSGSSVTGG